MLTLDPNDLTAGLVPTLLWSAGFLGLFLYLYRNRIFSIFDPLVGLAITQAAYCVMGLALIHTASLLLQFVASQSALMVGFLIVPAPRFRASKMFWTNHQIRITELTVLLLFVLMLSADTWLGIVAGFPVFSSNPSAAKFSVYAGGLGLVRRINSGVGVFVPAGALLLTSRGRHKKLFGVVFVLCMILSSLGGAKGSLVLFVQIIGYLVYRRDLFSSSALTRLRSAAFVLVVAATALGVVILYVVTEDWGLASAGLLQRILLQGDSIIYYYDPHVLSHFASYGPMDFLSASLNPLLGGLRLASYQVPLGFEMLTTFWGGSWDSDVVIGPNTPFFLVGRIYFGPVCGVAYCFAVGYFVAWMRGLFLRAQSVSPLRLIWLLSTAILVFYLPIEVNLFTSPLLDMSVMVFMAMAMAQFLLFILSSRHAGVQSLNPSSH